MGTMSADRQVQETNALLTAILDSTTDGILVVDHSGTLLSCNKQFMNLWKIPESIMANYVDNKAIEFVLAQLLDPDTFMLKVNELYANPETESFDVLEFKDGRVFERYSKPLRVLQENVGRVWTFRDVTGKVVTEKALKESEDNFRLLYEHAPIAYQLLDSKGKFLEVNQSWLDMTGYARDEVIGRQFSDFLTPEHALFFNNKFEDFKKAGGARGVEFEVRKKDGSTVVILFNGKIRFHTDGSFKHTQCVLSNITERKGLEQRLQQHNEFLQHIVESLPYPFYVINVKTHEIVLANSKVSSHKPLQGETCYEVTHHSNIPCNGTEHICPLQEVLKSKKSIIVEHLHYDETGEKTYFEVHGYPIFDENGNVTQMIEYSIDITKRREMEMRLQTLSVTDDLTGLFNRRGFVTNAGRQMRISDRDKQQLSLMYLDIDNMKWINDHLGHNVGDLALCETAKILKNIFRDSDIIGRIGGDEFAVLIVDKEDATGGKAAVSRLSKNLTDFNTERALSFDLCVSTGFVVHEPGETLEELMARADKLMYAEKNNKKKSHQAAYIKEI